MSQEWYYSRNGEQAGPITMEQLIELSRNGGLAPSDLVWHPSAADWTPAEQFSQLGFISTSSPAAALAMAAPILAYEGPGSPTGIVATARALEMLRQTKPWVLFIGILCYIAGGLMVVGGLIAGVIMGASGGRNAGVGAGMSFFYVLMGILYIGPAVFLTKYAGSIGRLMATRHSQMLESALEAQKSFWKFVGIMAAVIIAIYLVVLFVVMLAAIARW